MNNIPYIIDLKLNLSPEVSKNFIFNNEKISNLRDKSFLSPKGDFFIIRENDIFYIGYKKILTGAITIHNGRIIDYHCMISRYGDLFHLQDFLFLKGIVDDILTNSTINKMWKKFMDDNDY